MKPPAHGSHDDRLAAGRMVGRNGSLPPKGSKTGRRPPPMSWPSRKMDAHAGTTARV